MKHYNRIKTCEPTVCLNRTLPAPLWLPTGSFAAHHSVFPPEVPTIMNLSHSLAFLHRLPTYTGYPQAMCFLVLLGFELQMLVSH